MEAPPRSFLRPSGSVEEMGLHCVVLEKVGFRGATSGARAGRQKLGRGAGSGAAAPGCGDAGPRAAAPEAPRGRVGLTFGSPAPGAQPGVPGRKQPPSLASSCQVRLSPSAGCSAAGLHRRGLSGDSNLEQRGLLASLQKPRPEADKVKVEKQVERISRKDKQERPPHSEADP